MRPLKTICYTSKLLWYGFLNILIKLWFLFVFILLIILLPILIFLPHKIMINFGEITTNIALKILWITWRVIKWIFFITLGLVLIPLTPVLIIWAWLCGNLWAWTVSGGNPTLETKKRVYAVLGRFGVAMMFIFSAFGMVVGCISGEFLAPIIGTVAGFILWIFPTVDCFNLHDKAAYQIEAAKNRRSQFN